MIIIEKGDNIKKNLKCRYDKMKCYKIALFLSIITKLVLLKQIKMENQSFDNLNVHFANTDAERATFIKKTYLHLLGAILAFLVVEYFMLSSVLVQDMWISILSASYGWLSVLGLVMVGAWMANNFAFNSNRNIQYAGLGLYVVIEAIIFTPLLMIALTQIDGASILLKAGGMTVALFTGLTAVVITTGKDFSFLRSILMVGGFLAMGLIVIGLIFGFDLGLLFSVGMVLLAAGSILFETSKIFKTYPTDYYVGASLGLFASFMLLLWYVLRIFMSRD